MRLLLDTHALIWLVSGDDRLSASLLAVLERDDIIVFVIAVSAVEIAIKHRLGKLPDVGRLATAIETVVEQLGLEPLPISLSHARLAGSMSGDHRDPFDRMLAAQAIMEGLTLVSADKALDGFGVTRLW